jgi:hypothetical protein
MKVPFTSGFGQWTGHTALTKTTTQRPLSPVSPFRNILTVKPGIYPNTPAHLFLCGALFFWYQQLSYSNGDLFRAYLTSFYYPPKCKFVTL